MNPRINLPRRLTLAQTIADAHRLVTEMAAVGIRPVSESRVLLYLKALEERMEWKEGERDGECIRRYTFALQELSALVKIFDWLKAPPELKGWPDAYREISVGAFFPSAGADVPRDIQAELLFAGMAKYVGYQVELGDPQKGEPDVILHFDNERYAVEAKRPRSLEAIPNKVEIAARQIEKRELNGLIFVDLSVALAEEKRRILAPHAKVVPPPAQIETLDQLPRFIGGRQQHLSLYLSQGRTWIPPKRAHRVFGITMISHETVFIGPFGPQMPAMHPYWVWGNDGSLSPIGKRFGSDFQTRFARQEQLRGNLASGP